MSITLLSPLCHSIFSSQAAQETVDPAMGLIKASVLWEMEGMGLTLVRDMTVIVRSLVTAP